MNGTRVKRSADYIERALEFSFIFDWTPKFDPKRDSPRRAQGPESRLALGGNENSLIFMGYDEDLNQAMKIAVAQTVHWLATQSIVPMNREEAYALTSIVGD